ncbi:MAG: radical SAM protein [Alphaproteobacteria bacterium]|nr:radical SAM protein [Alphaproteobacteria bacterium]
MARLYSTLKYLSFADHLQALRERRVVAPVHIRIKPINRCNHNCWYCAYRVDNLKLGEDMQESDVLPPEKMFEIVGDVIAMGVKAVTFTGGGEPTLYKPLPEVVDRLAAGGVRVGMLTNGSNLQKAVAESFVRNGTWVRISMDAWDDESYVASRGARLGDFTKMLNNIRAFTASGTRCVLGVSYIVGKNNYMHLAEMAELLRDAGVDHVKFSGVVVSNDVEGNNSYHAEIKERVAEQIERARLFQSERFTVLNHYHDLEDRFEKNYTFCPFLQFLTIIGADQVVYTCQDKAFTSSGTLGSIRDISFKEFWFSDANRKRLYEFNPSIECHHHCVTHAKNLSILEYLSLDQDHAVFV